MVTKYKLFKSKSTKPFYEIDYKDATTLQNKLKKQGYYVTFHPTHLKIHTRIEEVDYKYLKSNKVF